MKNNVVCFFVDSVTWNSLGTRQGSVSPTPFLDSLKNESITASKLYSHGPYTDAATHSLFTGRDCLDDFGYFFKLNTAPIHHYKVFHEAGYETYDFNYPYYIIGNDIVRYIDHSIYSTGFIYSSEWGGIFSYYHDIIKKRQLNDDEYLLLRKRLDFMFESWERYLNDTIHRPETMRIHKNILKTYDSVEALKLLKLVQKIFQYDYRRYIDDFIQQGLEHVLATLDSSGIETYIDTVFIGDYIEKKYGGFLKKISWLTFRANVVKNCPSVKRLTYAFKKYIKTQNADNLLFLENYLGSLFPVILMRRRWKSKGWQTQHSAYTIYQAGLNLLRERKADSPFYFFFDVEDPHNNISFFSYDSQNKDIIDDEMRILKEYVEQVGPNFKGNLLYLLSLRYTDYQIQKFCEGLKQLGLWDTTSLLVISDHGSSYTFNPIHNRRVNNFDDECYHIPMLIRHPGLKGIEITSYQYSKDVLPTLLDVLGIEQRQEFKGRSMLRETQPRTYVLGEYMGPGCPDMLKRKIWFSARDEKYIIGYKVSAFEAFEEGELSEVYDLTNDPNAFYNINDKIDITTIQYLLEPIRLRHIEIKEDVEHFMSELRSNSGNCC